VATVTLSGIIGGPGAGSAGVIAHILVNGNEVYTQPIAAGVVVNYSVPNIAIQKGTIVDFAIEAANQTCNCDATSFTARISK
jgi:stage V sporulation protein SpoVS